MKLYDVKSGKIEYKITGSGEIMGQKMQTIGKKRVIFDDNGVKNLSEENKIDKQTIMVLTEKETKDLANFIGLEATKRGWKGLQTPYIPYFDSKPFRKVNFIFFAKKVGLYLLNITNIPIPEKIESVYFEWR